MWIKTIRGVLLNTDNLTTIIYDGNHTYGYTPGKNIIISNEDAREEIIEAICNEYDYMEAR